MKKYLGQHFLINKSKLKKIVEALELKDNDVVIEIGPGHGEITREIVERGKGKGIRIIAIEKDKYLAKQLSEIFQLSIFNFSAQGGSASGGQLNSNFQISKINTGIIIGDALKVLSELTNNLQPTTNNYKIVGNIPYYITGYLLRILGELEKKPSLIVLTIQKEVAERICAKAGSMNLLAASVQFWAKPEIVSYVSKKDFRPMPKVDSAIIRLKVKGLRLKEEEIENYYKFIKILFKQPRKTIANNLVEAELRGFHARFAKAPARRVNNRSGFTRIPKKKFLLEKLKKAGVAPNERPQDLSMEQILRLEQFFRVF